MAPESTRSNDRSPGLQHYTMKTTSRPPLISSHFHHSPNSRHMQSNLHSFRSNKASTPHPSSQSYSPEIKTSEIKVSPNAVADGSTPSPNYFGLSIERHGDLGDSVAPSLHDSWSPHGLSVKYFGAAIPKQVSVDANPDFEAFRRQVDANRATPFNLSSSYFAPQFNMTRSTPCPPTTSQGDDASKADVRGSIDLKRQRLGCTKETSSDNLHDSAYVSAESKRNSEASNRMCSDSFASADSTFDPVRKGPIPKLDDQPLKLSLPHSTAEDLGARPKMGSAITPQATEFTAPTLLLPSELNALLRDTPESEHLILDVRVATHYSQSRIRGALNLCIPTTLLKRAAFNLHKLQQTLQTAEDQAKFSRWDQVKHLIIYDATSTQTRDAVAAMNLFKKFMNEGFTGRPCLLKGGFHAFAEMDSTFIDDQSGADRGGTLIAPLPGRRPSFAPVIGGVCLPTGAEHPNPFFGNIRQNMDLADGVGQIEISVPSSLDCSVLPSWLREATQKADRGKKVSDRFLQIERNEQSRMRDAYSIFNAPTSLNPKSGKVQLCGMEKGAKNRYKDILPFEHTRVRLTGDGLGSCDYVNASYVKASRSHKRYIATQGPLPATFEDFWSVVWDHDVRVIVMLTAENEGGQLKCHPYWCGREFGPMRLKLLSENKVSLDMDMQHPDSTSSTSVANASEYGRRRANTTFEPSNGMPAQQLQQEGELHHVIIRKLALSHAAKPFEPIREITHLHYPTWPDFGTPARSSHLLALVELANIMQRSARPVNAKAVGPSLPTASEHSSTITWSDEPESDTEARPLLVHCSAGCGRTGTFCTVDTVVDILKRQRLESLTGMRKDADGDTTMEDQTAPPKKIKHENWPETPSRTSKSADVQADWASQNTVDLIEATVEDFRKQRLSMVQTLRQFVLCYESITEWIWRTQSKNNSGAAFRGRHRGGSLQGPR
ncbi:hypothetical protein GGS21DRAFT_287074 [Xylaria nigripes]|nr:hypothetical protein GGS21DRAFT_287074 [Xylaria nigripes]